MPERICEENTTRAGAGDASRALGSLKLASKCDRNHCSGNPLGSIPWLRPVEAAAGPVPVAAGAHTMHPPSDFVSAVEPPTSHSHILALAGYSTTRAGFHEPLWQRQTLGRQATAFPQLQESRPSTRLGQECSHSGPARPGRLPPALHLQQQQELGRPQPMVRRAVGVPELHTAGQEGSLGRQQGNMWPRISQVYQG